MNTLPIIRFELTGMKHTVQMMLQEHTAMLDEQVNAAIEQALAPGQIEGVVRRAVQESVNEAVSSEIQSFFRYSNPGRQAIREAVQAHLAEHWAPRAEGD